MASPRALPLRPDRLVRPSRLAIVPERLESCIRRLDPADRALLDLSLNRGIPDVAMAPILKTDPLRLAWKRARAIERVASRLGMTHPADLMLVRTALIDLPSRAWLPLELQPAKAPPVLEPPEPPGEEPRVFRPSWTARAKPPALPPAPRPATARRAEPAKPAQALAQPAQALVVREAELESTKGASPGEPAAAVGRAASSTFGGLSERAKRAYPRKAMTTRVRRAAGALALAGAAAALAFRRL